MDTTLLIAALGVTLGACSLIWQFYRDFSRRPRLEVSCMIGHIVSRGSGIDPTKQLHWNIVNAGQDNITVTSLSVKPVDTIGEMMLTNAPVPKILKHGEGFTWEDSLDGILEQLKEHDVEAIEHCIVRDSLGRKWYAPAKDVKSINADIQEILHPEKFPAPQTE